MVRQFLIYHFLRARRRVLSINVTTFTRVALSPPVPPLLLTLKCRSVPISRLPQLVYETQQDIERSGVLYSVVGHAGDGEINYPCGEARANNERSITQGTSTLSLSSRRMRSSTPCAVSYTAWLSVLSLSTELVNTPSPRPFPHSENLTLSFQAPVNTESGLERRSSWSRSSARAQWV